MHPVRTLSYIKCPINLYKLVPTFMSQTLDTQKYKHANSLGELENIHD